MPVNSNPIQITGYLNNSTADLLWILRYSDSGRFAGHSVGKNGIYTRQHEERLLQRQTQLLKLVGANFVGLKSTICKHHSSG